MRENGMKQESCVKTVRNCACQECEREKTARIVRLLCKSLAG